jgi:hypothetical protein
LRPVRAFVLAAVLTAFFAVVIWLFRELSADSIYLPVTLRNRYGLAAAGSMEASELSENLVHLLKDKKSIAVTTSTAEIDPALVAARIRDLFAENVSVQAYPAPLLAEGTAEKLHEADGIILAVPGGPASGKPLERTLEFLKLQGITVHAAILYDADEDLIRRYYRIGETN